MTMSAAIKPPPIAMAVLAIGAFWWLTQRRAVAAVGTPTYGTAQAVGAPAVQRYYVPPSGVVPGAQPTTLQTLLQFGTSLFSRGAERAPTSPAPTREIVQAYSYGGPSTGVYGVSTSSPSASDLVEAYSYGGPSTGVYGYSDGAGVADQVAASYAPNINWLQEGDIDPYGFF